jgi:hypothetical protein
VVSRRFDWMTASIGRIAFLSSMKSPRCEFSSSRPRAVARRHQLCARNRQIASVSGEAGSAFSRQCQCQDLSSMLAASRRWSVMPHTVQRRAVELSNNIIQKGLAFARDWSGTVVNTERMRAPRSWAEVGLRWCGATPPSNENGGSRCQRLRRSDHLGQHTRKRLPQSRRRWQWPIPLGSIKSIQARSSLASSPCCNRPRICSKLTTF